MAGSLLGNVVTLAVLSESMSSKALPNSTQDSSNLCQIVHVDDNRSEHSTKTACGAAFALRSWRSLKETPTLMLFAKPSRQLQPSCMATRYSN